MGVLQMFCIVTIASAAGVSGSKAPPAVLRRHYIWLVPAGVVYSVAFKLEWVCQ